MTAYNRDKYIGEAIQSVLACRYQHFELIVVDDCSADGTVEIAKKFAAADSRIKLFINEKNLGDYANRNRAASYACGKYLVNADSDDTMFETVLSKWVDEMEKHGAAFGMFSKMGNTVPLMLNAAETIRTHFFKKPLLMFGPGATIVEREFFFSMNGFPEKYGPANDMYHHIKLASSTPTLFFPFPLINYRLHDAQEINDSYGYLYNNYNYYRDVLKEVPLPLSGKEIKYLSKKNKRRFLTNLFKYLLKTSNFKKSAMALRNTHFSFKDFLIALFQL